MFKPFPKGCISYSHAVGESLIPGPLCLLQKLQIFKILEYPPPPSYFLGKIAWFFLLLEIRKKHHGKGIAQVESEGGSTIRFTMIFYHFKLQRDFLKTRFSRCILYRPNAAIVQIAIWFFRIIHCNTNYFFEKYHKEAIIFSKDSFLISIEWDPQQLYILKKYYGLWLQAFSVSTRSVVQPSIQSKAKYKKYKRRL